MKEGNSRELVIIWSYISFMSSVSTSTKGFFPASSSYKIAPRDQRSELNE